VRQITERTHLIAEIVAGATGYGIGWWRTEPCPGSVPRGTPGRDRPGGRSGRGRSGSGSEGDRSGSQVRCAGLRSEPIFEAKGQALLRDTDSTTGAPGRVRSAYRAAFPGRIDAQKVAISSGGLGAMSGTVAASP
jgi:hypothetical protein